MLHNIVSSEADLRAEHKLFACVVRQYKPRPGVIAKVFRALAPSLTGIAFFWIGAACVLPYLKG